MTHCSVIYKNKIHISYKKYWIWIVDFLEKINLCKHLLCLLKLKSDLHFESGMEPINPLGYKCFLSARNFRSWTPTQRTGWMFQRFLYVLLLKLFSSSSFKNTDRLHWHFYMLPKSITLIFVSGIRREISFLHAMFISSMCPP